MFRRMARRAGPDAWHFSLRMAFLFPADGTADWPQRLFFVCCSSQRMAFSRRMAFSYLFSADVSFCWSDAWHFPGKGASGRGTFRKIRQDFGQGRVRGTCVHVAVYTCTYARVHVCTCVRVYVCTCVRVHVCMCALGYVCTCVLVYLYTCVCVRVYVCTCERV